MSITKPTLTNPWAEATPGNIANPGGLNETGWTASSASPPYQWMNWVLNKIDKGVRYLMGRGIPDFDANESYSVGDCVQYDDSTWKCVLQPTHNQPPGVGGYWELWAFTATEFTQRFMDLMLNNFATFFGPAFSAAFDTQVNIVDASSYVAIDSGYGVTVSMAKAIVISTAKVLFVRMSGNYSNLAFPIEFANDIAWARSGMAFPFVRGSGQSSGSGTSARLESGQQGVLNVAIGGIGGLGATWQLDLMIVAP